MAEERNDSDWVEQAAEDLQKMVSEDLKWFWEKMSPKQAFDAAMNYRARGTLLKRSQQRAIIEAQWRARVGTEFPGWRAGDLYAVAGSAGIPAADVMSISANELYRKAIDAIVKLQPDTEGLVNNAQNSMEVAVQMPLTLEDGVQSQKLPREPVKVGNPEKAVRAIEALLGMESEEILAIARSKKSVDEKMRALCGVDQRFLSWESTRWADLLGVTDAAVRKTAFWKTDRRQAIEFESDHRRG